MIPFHESLSDRTVRLRYFHPIKFSQRVEHERLSRVCFNDYDRELALVAETREASGVRKIIGIGRLSKTPGGDSGEYAVLISDAWQSKGLGGKLLTRIVKSPKPRSSRRYSPRSCPITRQCCASAKNWVSS